MRFLVKEIDQVTVIHNGSYRDITFDIVRGIAIFIMIGANMGPILEHPHSMLFRFYGSIPAPIFILVAGLWVGLARLRKLPTHRFSYYATRGLFLVMVGALVDILAWRVYPFMTVDVLYLIGISLPVAYFFSRFPSAVVAAVAVAIFIATPLLQHVFGYMRYPLETWIVSGKRVMEVENPTSVLQHYFVDGWFPIFPWMGLALLGILLARWRWQHRRGLQAFGGKEMLLLASFILLVGAVYWYFLPGPMYQRRGFTEIFYPPTLGVLMMSLGVILFLLILADRTKHSRFWQPFRCLGEAPLFMYVVHLLIIGQLFVRFMPDLSAEQFLIVYAIFVVWLMVIGAIIRLAKREIASAPRWVQWIFGGFDV